MKEKARMHKYWCFDDSQTAQAAAWLEDLSKQGWALESIGLRFAEFVRCEPECMQYRFVSRSVFESYEQEEKRKEEYEKAGWKYIDYTLNMLVFRAEEGTAAVEIEGAPQRSLKAARRDLATKILWLAGKVALITGYILFHTLDARMFVGYLLADNLRNLTVLLFFAGTLYSSIRSIRNSVTEIARLTGGDFPEEYRPYETTILLKKAVFFINIVFFLAIVPGDFIFNHVIHNASDTPSAGMATLRAEEILVGMKDGAAEASADMDDCCVLHSLFIPEQLHMFTSVDAQRKSEYGGTIHASMTFEGYRALTPWLAKLLAEQLSRKYYYLNDENEHMPLPAAMDTKGFDGLWLHDYPGRQWSSLLAVEGNYVYYIDAHDGPASAEELAEMLYAKLHE